MHCTTRACPASTGSRSLPVAQQALQRPPYRTATGFQGLAAHRGLGQPGPVPGPKVAVSLAGPVEEEGGLLGTFPALLPVEARGCFQPSRQRETQESVRGRVIYDL